MGALKDIARKFKGALSAVQARGAEILGGRKSYSLVRVEDLPETLREGRLYVAGEAGYEWATALVCPCGCGDVIHLNLLSRARPCWTFSEKDGKVGLEPSVWRRQGCRSHFFLRRGEIEWCEARAKTKRLKRRWFRW